MVMVDDFTSVRAGKDVPGEGHVECCPKCGRNGVRHHEPDGISFVHVQESEVLSDGLLTEPRDCCHVPEASRT